jgi:hypothetical protein
LPPLDVLPPVPARAPVESVPPWPPEAPPVPVALGFDVSDPHATAAKSGHKKTRPSKSEPLPFLILGSVERGARVRERPPVKASLSRDSRSSREAPVDDGVAQSATSTHVAIDTAAR